MWRCPPVTEGLPAVVGYSFGGTKGAVLGGLLGIVNGIAAPVLFYSAFSGIFSLQGIPLGVVAGQTIAAVATGAIAIGEAVILVTRNPNLTTTQRVTLVGSVAVGAVGVRQGYRSLSTGIAVSRAIETERTAYEAYYGYMRDLQFLGLRPACATVGYEPWRGVWAVRANGSELIQNGPENVMPVQLEALAKVGGLGQKTITQHPNGNCAEDAVVDALLKQGANFNDIVILPTFRVRPTQIKPIDPCPACQIKYPTQLR